MTYESPAVRYQGGLNDLLHRLLPTLPSARNDADLRIAKLTNFIDSHDGRIGWDLEHACRELKLDITGAYAARLFKRSIGLGVREYAKKKRLSAAAELLKTTDLSVKAIAAEFGYRSPPDFTRKFKEQFHLSPTDFRRRTLCEANTSELLLSPRKPRSVVASRSLRRTA
jgi:AraC-like DNA-binding protein